MKTFSAKSAEVVRDWYLVDATTAPLGRVATMVATYLIGKQKPQYTAHVDGGDGVIVINAAKLKVTGNKLTDKKYYRHSGYPGGIKERSLSEQLKLDPTKVIQHAVRGMLPKNKLLPQRLERLKVYVDDKHPHEPQQPKTLEVK